MTIAKEKFSALESEINLRATDFAAVLVWIIVALFAGLAMIWADQLIRPDFLEYYRNNILDFSASIIIIFKIWKNEIF